MSERMVTITFPVKENILLSVKESKDEFTREILFLSAVSFYRRRRLSLGKAAELAKARKKHGYLEVGADFIGIMSVRRDMCKSFLMNQLDEEEAETILLANELPMSTEVP